MGRRFGGLWISLSELSSERIINILESGTGTLTFSLPINIISRGATCLSIVSVESDEILYLAVATATAMISDLELKCQIGPVKRLNTPLKISDLIDSIAPRFRRYVSIPTYRVTTVPEKTWDTIIESLISLGNIRDNDIEELRATMDSRTESAQRSLPDAVAFERDAIATAFEIFSGGLARKAYISSSTPVPDAPFIQRLCHRDLNVIEDTMIFHDILSFPVLIALQTALVGAVKLTTQSGTLTVLNANRTRIERTLGVDLVYYNHQFNSFVLVQYKRLRGGENPVYRPTNDNSLTREIERMRAFERGMIPIEQNYRSYRLIESPFFFKLCKSQTTGDWNGRMLPGMFFPLSLWDLLMQSESVIGVHGGTAIGFDSAKRRFNNTEFIQLVKQGWIGTTNADSERINNIIVEQLDAGHSIIAAVHEPKDSIEFVRDRYGRFASADDETAV